MSLNVNLYDSVVEQGMKLRPREREAFWRAVIEYVAYQIEPSLTGTPDICFGLVRPSLDKQRARAEAGGAGGQRRAYNAKQTASKAEANAQAKPKQTASKAEASDGQAGKQNPRELETEEEEVTNTHKARAGACAETFDPTSDAFVEPTPEEVEAEAQMRGCGKVDGREFVDYFAAQGWMRANGQPVTDWRRLLTGWRNRQAEFDAGRPRKGASADEFAAYNFG